MIKWAGFGKLLKQLFFISLISCFILLGNLFVKADGFVPIGQLGFIENNYDTNYLNSVLKKGRFLTQYLGTTKALFGLDQNTFVFWNNNKLYLYDKVNTSCNYYGDNGIHPLIQGYINGIRSCPLITTTGDFSTSSCGGLEFYSEEIAGNFISTLTNGDWFYYNESLSWEGRCRGYWYSADFCFSNNLIGQTLCFSVIHDPEGSAGGSEPFYGLGESLGFNDGLTFGLINRSYLEEPVGFTPGDNVEGGSQQVVESTLTGDTMNVSCTNNMAFQWYRANGYKSRMCYSSYDNNSDIYNGSSSVSSFALTGTDILDVWFDTWSYRRYGQTGTDFSYEDWFSYWRKTYEVYKKNSDISNPFVGVPVSIFTLMGNVDSYGLPYSNQSILEFCDLSLYSSDRLNKPYTGLAQNTVCSMSSIEYLDIISANELNPDDGYPGYGGSSISGTVGVIGSSWDGITNRSGYGSQSGLATFQDGLTFQNGYFNSLKSNFKFPDSTGPGVLPSYIIIAFCALIFFRFLRH